MHLIIATRGIKKEVDDFIVQMQGKYLPIKLKMKDGQPHQDGVPTDMMVQVNVQPLELWSLVFPKEHAELMYRTVFGESGGKPNNPKSQKMFWAIRKSLGLDPIPEYPKEGSILPVSKQAMEVVGIGIKEDKEHGFGEGL
jgi:hypothetical protein